MFTYRLKPNQQNMAQKRLHCYKYYAKNYVLGVHVAKIYFRVPITFNNKHFKLLLNNRNINRHSTMPKQKMFCSRDKLNIVC